MKIPFGVSGAIDTFIVMDDLPASTARDYSIKINQKGKVIGLWVQFYNTQGNLQITPTIQDRFFPNFLSGSQNYIALSNASMLIPVNDNFNSGDLLNVHANNIDPDGDTHKVRVMVTVQYG